MKISKTMSLALALSLASQSVALAAGAQAASIKETTQAAQKLIDESLIEQSVAGQTARIEKTIAQVDALIKSIEQYKNAAANDKQSSFVTSARLMITLLGLSAGFVHVKNVQAESSIALTMAAVSGALSALLEKYASGQKIDIGDIQNEILKNQSAISDDLRKAIDLSQEDAQLISDAIAQIGEINSEIQNTASEIQKQIDNGQMDVAIVSVLTLVMHYAAPFLPQKAKDMVAGKIPNTLSTLSKTKKQSQQALGASNIGTLFSTLIGMGSKNSQQQLNSILTNLHKTRSKLVAESLK